MAGVDIVSVENLEINVADEGFTHVLGGNNDFETVTFDFGGGQRDGTFEVDDVLSSSLVIFQNVDGDDQNFDITLNNQGQSIDARFILSNVDDFDSVSIEFTDDSALDDRLFLELANVSNTTNNMDIEIGGVENIDILVSADSTLEDLDHLPH